jgi:hypothetical protein
VVWPTLAYQGGLLLAFPRHGADQESAPKAKRSRNIKLALGIAVTAALFMFWLVYDTNIRITGAIELFSLAPLSIVLAFLYLFLALSRILDWDGLFDPKYLLKQAVNARAIAAVGFVAGIQVLLFSLASRPSPVPLTSVVAQTALSAVTKPGIFYLAHAVFYGPIIILALFWFDDVCRRIHRFGLGLTLCVLLGLSLALESESRRIVSFFPLLVPFVVKITDSMNWGSYQYWLFALIAIATSKVWLPIGGAPLYIDPARYPDQLYYMNHGQWMSVEMYVVQGAALVAIGVLLYFVYIRKNQR